MSDGVPGMKDVARLARVSTQTVSRVLNGHPHVRGQTRLRVLVAIQALGYRPSAIARTLVTGRSRLIGVVATADPSLYGPVSLLAEFERAAAVAGFVVAVRRVDVLDGAAVSEALERHRARQVAGIVVIAPTDAVIDQVGTLPAALPLVTVGGPDRATPSVAVDLGAGAFDVTRHVLAAGHPTVWHVSGPEGWFDSRERARGRRAALEAAGLEATPVVAGDWSAASGYRAGREPARMPDVTVVFAANDHLALGVLRAMNERVRHVPGDVSVVGFDDVPESGYFLPPLTTVRQGLGAVARDALSLLPARISGEEAVVHRTTRPTLVPRDSVRPPPPAP